MPHRAYTLDTETIRAALNDPQRLVEQLGLGRRVVAQRDGLLVCCPAHDDRTPSCSVRLVDGVVRAHCFACGFASDALGLIAAAFRLPTRGAGFRETLETGADLAGVAPGGTISRSVAPAARPRTDRSYPPCREVSAVWRAARPLAEDRDAQSWCERRGLDVASLDHFDLARVVSPAAKLPRWARFRGQLWTNTGHRVVVPVYDSRGAICSLRAVRVTDGDTPKRLPPARHRAAGLVLADAGARRMLAGHLAMLPSPLRIVIAEGEPDYLTWATRFSDADEHAPVVLGVVAGAWTSEIAGRIPDGSRVAIWTHCDLAGDGYAAKIAETLGARVELWRAA